MSNTVNVINATGLYTSTWLILCYVTFTSIKKKKVHGRSEISGGLFNIIIFFTKRGVNRQCSRSIRLPSICPESTGRCSPGHGSQVRLGPLFSWALWALGTAVLLPTPLPPTLTRGSLLRHVKLRALFTGVSCHLSWAPVFHLLSCMEGSLFLLLLGCHFLLPFVFPGK